MFAAAVPETANFTIIGDSALHPFPLVTAVNCPPVYHILFATAIVRVVKADSALKAGSSVAPPFVETSTQALDAVQITVPLVLVPAAK